MIFLLGSFRGRWRAASFGTQRCPTNLCTLQQGRSQFQIHLWRVDWWPEPRFPGNISPPGVIGNLIVGEDSNSSLFWSVGVCWLPWVGIGLKEQLKAGHVWQVQTQKKALPFYNKVPTKRFPKTFCLNIHHSICIQPLSLAKLIFLGHLTRIRCTTSRPTIFFGAFAVSDDQAGQCHPPGG